MPTPDPIASVQAWVARARRSVVLAGAGISTDSGIADFRGPQGVWTKHPAAEKQSTLPPSLADPQLRQAAWRSRLASPVWLAQPNRGHRALLALEQCGQLLALITQNIDGLHQEQGHALDDRRLTELAFTVFDTETTASWMRLPNGWA